MLAINYGQGAFGLAQRLGISLSVARAILQAHQDRYPAFWKWITAIVSHAQLNLTLHTALGWPIQLKGEINSREILNFPMQGNGAEIMRLACCLGTENGISVCCNVHDAVLIEAPLEQLDGNIARMRELMREAGRTVLSGFEIGVDAKIVRYPDRLMDEKRGGGMWGLVMALLCEIEGPGDG